MTAYKCTTSHTLTPDFVARKAARKKVIEAARRLERDSYKAMMRRNRRLHASSSLDTIGEV